MMIQREGTKWRDGLRDGHSLHEEWERRRRVGQAETETDRDQEIKDQPRLIVRIALLLLLERCVRSKLVVYRNLCLPYLSSLFLFLLLHYSECLL